MDKGEIEFFLEFLAGKSFGVNHARRLIILRGLYKQGMLSSKGWSEEKAKIYHETKK
jgi:hypothetical protein